MDKKVLIIATVYSFISHFEKNDIKLLQELGYKVVVASNFEGYKNELEHLNVEKLNINFARSPFALKNLKSFFQLNKYIKNNKIDLIHCHTPVGGVIARLIGKFNKTKVIYTAHGFHFFKGASLLNWLIYYPIEKILSKYTDVLITINNEDYELAKNKFYAKKVEYIPGVGVDTEKIAKIEVDKKKKREELGLKEDEIILLSVGELSTRKNHIIPIRALEKLKQYNIKYLICGIGNLDKYLKDECKKLRIEDKVIFLGYRKDIYELCKISDIYIFPSLQEGLPVALMEAMATGLPVIASNIRGNNDLVENDINGFLINSESEYSEKIEIFLQKINLRLEIGKENNKKIKNNFDIKIISKKMREIYSKL
nr:glycosyltransferase family 4 protein [Fusobacterium gastrosuis]